MRGSMLVPSRLHATFPRCPHVRVTEQLQAEAPFLIGFIHTVAHVSPVGL